MDIIFDLPKCNITFVLKDEILFTNAKTIVILTVFYGSGIYSQYPSKFLYQDGFKYSLLDFHPSDVESEISIQGTILFDDESIHDFYCPLELICKEKPFEIVNDTQIIHIRTAYINNQKRTKPCFWQFSTLEEYGFKVVIQKFDVSTSTVLTIKNTTDIILNEKSIKTFHAYYNSDKFLFINLSEGDPNFVSEMQFQAYISIVKKNYTETNGNCSINYYNKAYTTWTYLKNNGYQNNIFCQYNSSIPVNTFLYIELDKDNIELEEGVDDIKYFEDGNLLSLRNIKTDGYLIIWPYENGTEKMVLWEFSTDGNIVFQGFEIKFWFFPIECTNVIPKCDDHVNYLMNNHFADYFFGHLECNFTIPSCYPELTQFSIEVHYAVDAPQNIFQVFSDDEIVLKINDLNSNDLRNFEIFLNSSKKNFFQAFTYPSYNIQRLSFWIENSKMPDIKKIILKENSYTVIEYLLSNDYEYISFEANENVFLEFYCAHPRALALYPNGNLDKLMNCLYDLNQFRCRLNQTSFVINYLSSFNEFIVVKQTKKNYGCIFGESVFVVNFPENTDNDENENMETFLIAAFANNQDRCKIVIIINDDNRYQFTHLWTTAKTQNVKVYIGPEQTIFFFEFNSITAKKIKNIVVGANIYTISIPKGASLYILLEKVPSAEFTEDAVITSIDYPMNSFLITSSYGCIQSHGNVADVIYSIADKYPLKFTAIEYNVPHENDLYFELENGTRIHFYNVGDSVIFFNQTITFYQITHSNSAIFYIESLKEV